MWLWMLIATEKNREARLEQIKERLIKERVEHAKGQYVVDWEYVSADNNFNCLVGKKYVIESTVG